MCEIYFSVFIHIFITLLKKAGKFERDRVQSGLAPSYMTLEPTEYAYVYIIHIRMRKIIPLFFNTVVHPTKTVKQAMTQRAIFFIK